MFDPACGSGNFLTESYLSLRRLENDILRETVLDKAGSGVLGFDEAAYSPIKVSIQQFYGIEINDFAVSVAKTAIWIAESQMMQETEGIVHHEMNFLPLTTNANIHEGNALRMDWKEILPPGDDVRIMGNPPFVGYSLQSKEQKDDIRNTYVDANGTTYTTAGKVDYVAAWYFKASEYMQGTKIRTAFVSTNSITQGEQVSAVWKPLYERFHIEINFAYQTFRWNSESKQKAAVHCVIIGFCAEHTHEKKKLFTNEHKFDLVDSINPYLLNAPVVFIESRKKPLSNIPSIVKGSSPVDGQNLLLSEEEYLEALKKDPELSTFIHPFLGAKEFLHNKKRYCLWLINQSPSELKKHPFILERGAAVRDFRLHSKLHALTAPS